MDEAPTESEAAQPPIPPPPGQAGMREAVHAQLFGRPPAGAQTGRGTVLAGRYQLEQPIGSGAMGVVWRAVRIDDGRQLAIKLVRCTDALEGTAVPRLIREAAAMRRIDHPGVVAVLDSGRTDEGAVYVVMELVEGITLAELLARDGQLPWRRARALAVRVAEALAAAHALGIVHRDLNPSNVMLVAGRDEGCKVLDFGLAKVVQLDTESEHLTGSGMVFGTPRYISPEQASGRDVDGRADQYSLACLLYEMVAGRPAFEGRTLAEVLYRQLRVTPTPLRELSPKVMCPRELDRVLARALAKPPEARFADLHAFADALRSLDELAPSTDTRSRRLAVLVAVVLTTVLLVWLGIR